MGRKLYIKTYGCQMNAYDSNRMADVMAPHGYTAVQDPADADLIVLNTCHIRDKAAEKVYSELGRLRSLKKQRADAGDPMMIAVAGCVAQAEGAEIMKRADLVDMVLGPQVYHRLPEMVARARRSLKSIDTEFPVDLKFDALPAPSSVQRPSAFLTVQEGCDKFCTFCVVPYTRGAEYSRPVADIVREATQLVELGAREITLLGQNVNAYCGADEQDRDVKLAGLVSRLAEIDGLLRIRYMTSHPRDMSDDLIEAHAREPKLMPYLHLPIQSGSDAVLEAMNRGHTGDDYLRLIDRIRGARADIALSSDFIVGFPGETETDFQHTMKLIERVGFAQSYSFKYSKRPGTPASAAPKQIAEDVKSRRLAELQGLLQQQADSFAAECVDREMPVLVERAGRHSGQVVGKSPYLQAVFFDAKGCEVGDLVEVTITETRTHSLAAKLSPHASKAALT